MKRIFITTLLISLVGFLNLSAQERIFVPELSLPENNAVDQMPDVVLDWNAVTGGNTGIILYDIQLDIDPAFPNPTNFQTEFLTAVQASKLMFGGTYYWRVRAKDGNDVSGWSETRSFRVIRRVILTGPSETVIQNDTVKLSWTSMTGISDYEYQLDTVYFWKPINSGLTSNLSGVSVVDETHSWIVGQGGLILFNDGNSWTEQESTLSTDIYSVSFLDASNGWAVGKGGKIIHYDGTAWAAQSSGITTDLNSVSMLDANNGWAVGKSGVVLYYNGTSWTTQFTASKDLASVFAVDANHVWAAGKGGLVVFYNGSSWTVQDLGGSIKDFAGIAFTSANDGWVVGKTGTIFHYVNGTWISYDNTSTQKNLTGIFLINADNAYIVGATGTLLSYDGIDWSSQSSSATVNFNSVGFSGTAGYLVGEGGTIVAYNDEAFTSPMATIRHANSDLTAVKINDLLFGTQYYWRMRAKHSLDISEWSGARSFNTRATVALDKPSDNSTDQVLDQLLQWKNQFSSEVTYEIQVDDDPAYGSPVFLSTDEVSVNAEFLKFGVEYNWRVRVLDAFDVSDWTESWTFTTINTVELTSPADAETDVKLSPLLTWDAQTGIEGYQVLVATNNSFTAPLVDAIVPVTESSFIVPVVLDKDALYYWRVRAVNGLDTSGWSGTWSFRTLPPVGIDEPGLEARLDVYPNPVENTVYIQYKDKQELTLNITITDLVGMKVIERQIALGSGTRIMSMDLSILQEGIYLMRIADKNRSYTKKIVIKR
jgi:photosystem II stability/assembly factor-like uncharacterized protein